MRLIDSNVEEWFQEPGIDGVYKMIAKAGRICYASTKEDDGKDFVTTCIKNKHKRPLEFGSVYLKIPTNCTEYRAKRLVDTLMHSHYTKYVNTNDNWYFSTNYRVIVENNLEDCIDEYWSDDAKQYNERYYLHWTISRATADSFRTHTMISSLMQSTRYCNYSKGKFGGHLTLVRPYWINIPFGDYDYSIKEKQDFANFAPYEREYITNMLNVECRYNLYTTEYKLPAEAARSILPLDTKTEFIQCAFKNDWNNFFSQRIDGTTGKPHPDAKSVSEKARIIIEK